MPHGVVVFSAGVVSAFGPSTADAIAGYESATSAVGEITGFEAHEDSPGLGAELKNFDVSAFVPSIKGYIDRCTALALRAAQLAFLPDAPADLREKVGLIFGSEFACAETMRLYGSAGLTKGWRFAPPFVFIHSYANTPAAMLHIEHGLKGFSNVFSGYREAGVHALLDAYDAVATGAAECVLAGAADALGPLRYDRLFRSGALGTIDEPIAGAAPGEGAAFMLIAREGSELARAVSGSPLQAQMTVTRTPPPEDLTEPFLYNFGDCGSANVPIAAAVSLLCPSTCGKAAFRVPDQPERNIWLERK